MPSPLSSLLLYLSAIVPLLHRVFLQVPGQTNLQAEYWFWQLSHCWSWKVQEFIQKGIRISCTFLGICPGYSYCCCLSVSHIEEKKKKDEKKKRKKETFEVDVTEKQNIIHEKAKFAKRCQEQGQADEAFITADQSFAEHCIYWILKEELIRGRIIFGKRDNQFISRTYTPAQITLTGLEQKWADLHTGSTEEIAADHWRTGTQTWKEQLQALLIPEQCSVSEEKSEENTKKIAKKLEQETR